MNNKSISKLVSRIAIEIVWPIAVIRLGKDYLQAIERDQAAIDLTTYPQEELALLRQHFGKHMTQIEEELKALVVKWQDQLYFESEKKKANEYFPQEVED